MASSHQNPTILLLNLPAKTFVGINLASFNSSPNFHGITNLPSGLHFLYTGTDASLSIRHGDWLRIKPYTTQPQIYVLRWNHEHESLDLLEAASNAALSASRAIPTLQGRGLVDYTALRSASATLQASQSNNPNQTANTDDEDADADNDDGEDTEPSDPWPLLTSHITSQTLTRILSTPSSPPTTWTLSSISSSPQDTEQIPGLSVSETTSPLHEAGSSPLKLVPINLKQTWPVTSLGRDRTHKARDKSWYLGFLIDSLTPQTEGGADRTKGAGELLGELQFCFLMVLTLSNYSCLEQWKRILAVFLGCRDALGEVQGYFVEVVRVVRAQLGRVEDVEGGLFEMGDEVGSAWLRGLMGGFSGVVDEVFGYEEGWLRGELKGLEEWLRETYGWVDEGKMLKRGMVDLEDGERVEVQMDGLDEEEESGEYAPVVVEL